MNKKIITTTLAAVLAVQSGANLHKVHAVDTITVNANVNHSIQKSKKVTNPATPCVDNVDALKSALENRSVTKITLNGDIEVLGSLKINRSVTLDLNGHKIKFLSSHSIVVGENLPVAAGAEENEDSYSCMEFDTRYFGQKDISVVIENGTILAANGADGQHKKHGTRGQDGGHAIIMKSGNLTLKNMKVFGGNGGNGAIGDTKVSRSGGNAGTGGNALQLEGGNELKVCDTYLRGGNHGIGGRKHHSGLISRLFSRFYSEGQHGNDGKAIANLGKVKISKV